MNTYKITYSGNSTRYKKFEAEIWAQSKREAVEAVYQQAMDKNYFPQDDGSIFDCSGNIIASPTDVCIEYDGGYFSAEIVL